LLKTSDASTSAKRSSHSELLCPESRQSKKAMARTCYFAQHQASLREYESCNHRSDSAIAWISRGAIHAAQRGSQSGEETSCHYPRYFEQAGPDRQEARRARAGQRVAARQPRAAQKRIARYFEQPCQSNRGSDSHTQRSASCCRSRQGR